MRFYEAGQVADACVNAQLDAEASWWVDRQCAFALLTQPWARVRSKVDGWILMADPALAAERAARAAEARKVGVGAIINGHCDLWGRLNAADGIAFDQALTAIAATLPVNTDHSGGTDIRAAVGIGGAAAERASLDQRRAAAVGILARRALGQPELPRTAEIVVRIDATVSSNAILAATPSAPSCSHGGEHVRTMLVAGRQAGRDSTAVAEAQSAAGIKPRQGQLVLAPVAEVEGWGAVLAAQLGDLLAGRKVTIRPVVDTRRLPSAGGYEIPDPMRLAVTERWPVDAFPYGVLRSTACDLDHSTPYGNGGMTEVDNLAPLKRFGHRVRTHGGWTVEQPEPGWLTWMSPHGYTYAVTPSGTLRIGRPPPREHDWWNQEPPDWLDDRGGRDDG